MGRYSRWHEAGDPPLDPRKRPFRAKRKPLMRPLSWHRDEEEGPPKRRAHLVIAEIMEAEPTISVDAIAEIMEREGYNLGELTIWAIRDEIRKAKRNR